MTAPDPGPFTGEARLCDDDGIVRQGLLHDGTDYHCTGSAHVAGEHLRCTSPAHAAPQLNIDVPVAWCPRHLEPFRANWPDGYLPATMTVVQAAIAMPAVADACGQTPDGLHDATGLNDALRRFQPLCCFISPAALDEAYTAAGISR